MPALTAKMASVVERMARAGRPPLNLLTPDEARAAYEKGAGVLEVPKPQLARVEDFSVPARDGHALPVRLYAPSGERLPLLLFFHGGGFTVGSIATHDTLCRVLSQRSGCAVVSVDYRLAPAHRFPTASNDAWDALAHIAGNAAQWGLDGSRIAVGGDSAGGTLAAVCAILARDAGLPVALQLLFYPGMAAHQDTDSHRRYADWTIERIRAEAGRIGASTLLLCDMILAERPHPEQGFRACLGIVRLTRGFGAERVDAACARALEIGARTYGSVRSILDNRLDRQPVAQRAATAEGPAIAHPNIRGPRYYH